MINKHFPNPWKNTLEELGFTTFTTIQEKIFEPISNGDTVLGISPTGTGKTLAYLFPILLKLQPKKALPKSCRPQKFDQLVLYWALKLAVAELF